MTLKGGALRVSRPRTSAAPLLAGYPAYDPGNAGKTMLENSSTPTPKLSAATRCQSKTYANPRPCIPRWKITGSPVGAGSRNREAAFELALKSPNPFSVGDRVSYYIIAGKGPSYDRARLASNWNPLSRDEDIRYYLKQLEDVAKLFDEFTSGRSRQGDLYNSQHVILIGVADGDFACRLE